MKKRMLLLGMAIWMAAALTGCGNDTTDSTDQATAADQEQSENATDKTQTDGSQTDANIEQVATGAPVIWLEHQEKDWYSEDDTKWLMHAENQLLYASIPGNDAAAQKINDWSEAEAESVWKAGEEMASEAADYIKESAEYATDYQNDYTDSYCYNRFVTYSVMRADAQVISLESLDSSYLGGAHGNYYYEGTTFDTMTGEKLKIQDIVTDMPSFRQQATKDIDKYLQENYGDGLFEDYQDTVEQIWESEDGFNWYLNESGIMVIFNPYAVGPFAMGSVTVPLPYSAYASFLNPNYTTPETISAGNGELMEETVTKIRTSRLEGGVQQTENSDAAAQTDSGNSDAAVAQTGSGNTPVNYGDLNVYMDQKNEFGGGTLTIELNEQKEQTEYFDRLCDSQILYLEDGRVFVLLVADHASDDYELFLYEVTDGKLKLTDQQDNLFLGDGSVSAGGRKNGMLMLKKNVNVFGSYQCSMTYSIGDDGKLVPDEEFFQVDIDNYPYSVLTVTREIPVSVNGGQTTLQTGTQIRITGTNDAGIALFETTDGKVSGEIHYTEPEGDSEFYHKINGITEDQYFESIPYAG